jgi:hypothetical protein
MADPAEVDGTAACEEDGAGGGETEVVPPVTEAGSELAWSQDDDTAEPVGRQPWSLALTTGAVVILGAAVLLGVR